MHAYTGVDCKECKSFIALREVLPGTEGGSLSGEYKLSCPRGHRNTYMGAEFYILESEMPQTLPALAARREQQPLALLYVALLLALLMLIGWLMVTVFFK